MTQLFTNNASGTLSVQAETIDTTLTLQSTEGQLFPAPTGADFFQCTLEDTSGNIEIVQCTGKSTDVLTVIRAQESTSAKVFPTGSKVELRPTAATQDSFLQVFGGVMQGELDMNNELLTDPLLTGGEIRNSPLRGTDGGTANEIIVPTAAGAPTLGGNTIVHTGIDGIYALDATTATAGDVLTGGGTLGANFTFDFDMTTLSSKEGNDFATADEMLVLDAGSGNYEKMAYSDAGLPITTISDTTDVIDVNDMNRFLRYTNGSAITITINDSVSGIVVGNFMLIYRDTAATLSFAGTATLEGVSTAGVANNGSVVTMYCRQAGATTIWVVYGDAI